MTACFVLSAKDRQVTDEMRTFYSQCGSTIEDVFALYLRQTYSSTLRSDDFSDYVLSVDALVALELRKCVCSLSFVCELLCMLCLNVDIYVN